MLIKVLNVREAAALAAAMRNQIDGGLTIDEVIQKINQGKFVAFPNTKKDVKSLTEDAIAVAFFGMSSDIGQINSVLQKACESICVLDVIGKEQRKVYEGIVNNHFVFVRPQDYWKSKLILKAKYDFAAIALGNKPSVVLEEKGYRLTDFAKKVFDGDLGSSIQVGEGNSLMVYELKLKDCARAKDFDGSGISIMNYQDSYRHIGFDRYGTADVFSLLYKYPEIFMGKYGYFGHPRGGFIGCRASCHTLGIMTHNGVTEIFANNENGCGGDIILRTPILGAEETLFTAITVE